MGNRLERSRNGGAWGFGLSPARPTAWQPEQFSVTSALPRAMLSSAFAPPAMLPAHTIARPNKNRQNVGIGFQSLCCEHGILPQLSDGGRRPREGSTL